MKNNEMHEDQQQLAIQSPESMIYQTHLQHRNRRQLFNQHWKFIYSDQTNAHLNTYDDATWENINLPHDYSLTLPYTPSGEAESGYKLGGIAWYRKSFTLDESLKDKRIFIEFGGVYMNATVFINGHRLGTQPYGYSPFAFDLTDDLLDQGENILAVRVDHKFPSSRWYSGSGIYRNVHVTITDQIFIDHYGIKVTTPHLDEQIGEEVDVCVQTKVNNKSSEDVQAQVKQSIRKKESEVIITSQQSEITLLKKNSSTLTDVSFQITNPDLWSVANPHLYEIITEVIVEGETVDHFVTDYGFRTFSFDQKNGFYLNGQPLKLKGVCMHHDQGALGSAAHERAIERQVEILKEMGANAIRMAHNPAADEWIDLANRKGLLVIDEAFDTWVKSKNGNNNDYAVWFQEKIGENEIIGSKPDITWAEFDLKTMVKRGINAPSIIMWSVGNEVMEGNSGPYDEYPDLLVQLVQWVAEEDQTRPSTIGDNKLKAFWEEAIEIAERLTHLDGIVGFNYVSGADFDHFRKNYPDWKIYGAETASSINSRGVYQPEQYNNHLTAYDESVVGWGHLSAHSWYIAITRDFNAGEFVWTGFDYLGEPTPWNNVGSGATGGWPSPKSSYFGIIDTAGNPKDRYYFYQSQWNEDINTLHLLPTWEKDSIPVDDEGNVRVDVYTHAKTVELFFVDKKGTEKSFGKKTFTRRTTAAGHTYQIYEGPDKKEEDFRNLYLTWEIPYEEGTVYAKAYDEKGNIIHHTVGRSKITTFKEPKQLYVTCDRETMIANDRDLAYLTMNVLDEDGNAVENAENLIEVTVSDEGRLLALDNGDQTDHEPYDSGKRQAFNGKLIAIIQAKTIAGKITVQIDAEDMESQTITLQTKADPEHADERRLIGYTLAKNHYVKLGNKPNLPRETTLHFSDHTTEVHAIEWVLDHDLLNQPGTFQVIGHTEAYDVQLFANISVIESVAGILNYSVATETGVDQVSLPVTRPLILENSDILPIEFPVTWDTQNKEDYQKPGIITINGTADVFGEEIPVLATIRVDEVQITYGDNIAQNYLTLTASHQSPKNLGALVDGVSDNAQAIWTNDESIQAGSNKSEVIFTYATAQFLGSLDIFYQQNEQFSPPTKVDLYWSNEGTEDAEWIQVNQVKAREKATENGLKVNYRFSGVPAVGFKIVLHSTSPVGVSEIELRIENNSLIVHDNAKLDDIIINGKSATREELTRQVLYTREDDVSIEAISHENVAVTVLDRTDDKIHLLTESEDHLTREKYTIHVKE